MKSGEGKPTITDVARLAEVSMKTVSRVINKEPNVSEALRERVTRAAALLGYQPNISARSLAGVRSFLIGFLFGDPGGDYTHRVEVGLLDRCRGAGYHLMVEQIDAKADDVAARTSALVSQLRLDGVVLTAPITDHRDVLRVLDAARVPYVRIAPDVDSDVSPVVRIDDARAVRELTAHLLGLGHRRIGFIKGNPAYNSSQRRFNGYLAALAEADMALDPALVTQGLFNYRSGLDAAEQLLDQSQPPTAIFACNDDMAAAVVAIAHGRGIDIPGDLTVCGYDDTPLATTIWPELTTIHQPISDMARTAVDLLVRELRQRPGAPPEETAHVVLDYKLVRRQSDAAPRRRPRRGS